MANVDTKNTRYVWINIRVNPLVRADFKIAAALRGAKMAGLIHQFIVKVIREEKEKNPQSFLPDADASPSGGQHEEPFIAHLNDEEIESREEFEAVHKEVGKSSKKKPDGKPRKSGTRKR